MPPPDEPEPPELEPPDPPELEPPVPGAPEPPLRPEVIQLAPLPSNKVIQPAVYDEPEAV